MGIPQEVPPPQRAHIDTNILRYLLDPEEDSTLKGSARGLIFGPGEKLPVCISCPVAGELVALLAKDTVERDAAGHDFERAMATFWRYIKEERLELFMFGRNAIGLLRIAERLFKVETRLETTDAIILASFVADNQAVVFFTTDPILLGVELVSFVKKEWGKSIRPLP